MDESLQSLFIGSSLQHSLNSSAQQTAVDYTNNETIFDLRNQLNEKEDYILQLTQEYKQIQADVAKTLKQRESKISNQEGKLVDYQQDSISPRKQLKLDSITPGFGSVEKPPDTQLTTERIRLPLTEMSSGETKQLRNKSQNNYYKDKKSNKLTPAEELENSLKKITNTTLIDRKTISQGSDITLESGV